MKRSQYVVVYLSGGNDLYAQKFADYDEALAFVEESEEKAYIIRIEGYCADGDEPTVTLEPHT